MRAVTEGRVYCIPDEFLNTPAHPLLQGLACLAAAIHPNSFPVASAPHFAFRFAEAIHKSLS